MRTQRILPVILAVLAASSADAMSRVSSWCEQGAKVVVAPATVGGSPISRSFMQSYPGCTVTVYITGTVTIAPIFSDNSGTPLSNPFSATTLGYWDFYAANGRYDVQISGGGLGAPFTFGDVGLFDAANFIGQPQFSVQFNNGANPPQLGGAPGFTYNPSTQVLTETGLSGTAGIHEATGYILSDAGFQTPNNSINAFQGLQGGANVAAVVVPQTSSVGNGSYIHIPPISYNPYDGPPCHDQWGNSVQQPVVVPGDTFGTHDVVMWNGLSPEMPANGSCGPPLNVDLDYGLFINTYFLARGGLSTTQTSYNSIQSLSGGVFGIWLTAQSGTYIGTNPGPPPLIGGQPDIKAGAMFYDTVLNALMLCASGTCSTVSDAPGTGWVKISGGGSGGGNPGAPTYSVQFNNGSTPTFTGDNDLLWYPAGTAGTNCGAAVPCLQIGATAGTGFLAVNGNSPATVNVASGGITSKWMTPTIFIQSSATTSGTAGLSPSGAGKIFFDGTHYQVSENGGAYVPMLAAAGCPGATSTSQVLYNNAGVCAGSANLSWNNGAQRLTITGTGTVGAPGLLMLSTSVQADQGFAAILQSAPTTPLAWNIIQAPTGGLAGLSGTFTNYVQAGSFTGALASGPPVTTSDTIAVGTISYSNTSNCLAAYIGTVPAWTCLASGGGTSPGNPANSVQTNVSGSFGGSADFLYNDSTKTVTIGNSVNVGLLAINGNSAATVNAPNGGMTSKWMVPTVFIQSGGTSSATAGLSPAGSGKIYFDSGTLHYYVSENGGAYVPLVGGGGGSITSIVGTANEVIVTNGTGPTVTLATPQPIGTSSTPLFAGVQATGAFASAATGATTGLSINSGVTSINGQGDISAGGSINMAGGTGLGAYRVAGTIIVDANRNANFLNVTATYAGGGGGVFQSTAPTGLSCGGFNCAAFTIANSLGNPFIVDANGDISSNGVVNVNGVGASGACSGAYCVSGTAAIDGSRNGFFHNVTITGTCTGCSAGPSGITGITASTTATGPTLTFLGTTNRVTVTNSGNTFTFTGPQDLGTGSTPTFANVNASGTFQSTVTAGSGTAFDIANGLGNPFIVNGNGDISARGSINMVGATGFGAYRVNSTVVIDSSLNFSARSLNLDIGVSGGVLQMRGTTIINNSAVWVGAGMDSRFAGAGATGFNFWNGSSYQNGVNSTTCSQFLGGICVAP